MGFTSYSSDLSVSRVLLLRVMSDDFSVISMKSDPTLSDLDRVWKSTNPAAAEVLYQQLLPSVEGSKVENQSSLVLIYSQIARAQAAQGKFSDAHDSLKKAEMILKAAELETPTAKIHWLLEGGRLSILEKTPSQARPKFIEAWTLAIGSGEDLLAVDAATMMAQIEPRKLQQDWIEKGIRIAEKSSQDSAKERLGGLYTSSAWRLYDLRQFELALASFQKALTQFKANGSKREVFVARWSIGKSLRAMNRTEEALEVQNILLSELGVEDAKDGRLFEELAECLHALKRATEAQHYFELAYRELSSDEWVVDNQPVALQRLKELGKVKRVKEVK